eukprot:CAMPEP_0168569054 /NCGR_PEP_ID=MMETSP0413-20121227/15921_1 /TAXON_ID=136452 /ORGANISM="Filamoeba nolandi, Strain NC-AS-23-1" /LENGTH=138 /DNA_ID=CAMNT_0008601461 /DNA_START=149 /DNA_END=565 /DNA_ORIENTATION=-
MQAYSFVSENSFWSQRAQQAQEYLFDEEVQIEFPKVMYWYFYHKNKDVVKLISSSSQDYNILTKVLLVGKEKVGKSKIHAVLDGKPFVDSYATTIGVEFCAAIYQYNNTLLKALWLAWRDLGNLRGFGSGVGNLRGPW